MNDEDYRSDDMQAEAKLDRMEQLKRRLRRRPLPTWRNATVEAQRSTRLNIELQQDIERERRQEEYAS